jgi:undecaprenyl-diphosphatase
MIGMQFLKENKSYLIALALLPLFFYFDMSFVLWIRAVRKENPALNCMLESIDPVTNIISHGATLAVIACVLYMIGKYTDKRLSETGKYLCLGFVTTGILAQILKHLFGRARPKLMDESLFIGPTFQGAYDSFPSGHTAIAFCFAYILARYFPKGKIIFFIYAVIVAFERVEDKSHFPSDVLAGAILGMVIGKMLLETVRVRQENRHNFGNIDININKSGGTHYSES